VSWRDPRVELPYDGQVIFVMIEPHKKRGSLRESIQSIMIVCGQWRSFSPEKFPNFIDRPKGFGRIENMDEYGWGWQSWFFSCHDESKSSDNAIGWIPVEEMPLPGDGLEFFDYKSAFNEVAQDLWSESGAYLRCTFDEFKGHFLRNHARKSFGLREAGSHPE
jgi:hypothetical protein